MENSKIKIFSKPAKGKMTVLFTVFLWIMLWNVIYQALHGIGLWENWPIQIENWAFFISVTIFFMQEELSLKERFFHTLFGGIVGLLIAAGVVLGCKALMGLGLSHFGAICICLCGAIALLILGHPYMPMFINNVGFCYFIISLINSSEAVSALPSHIVSLVLGSICLNAGVILVLTLLKKFKAKKASK